MDSPVMVIGKPVGERKIIVAKNNQVVPDEFINDPQINQKIREELPLNYNFEIHKIIWRIRKCAANRVALQFPEGLFIFSTAIAKIIEDLTGALTFIIADVTYGACCVDDYITSLAQCQLLIHFGHSCLIPTNSILDGVKVMYVVVDVSIDYWHLLETFKFNFTTKNDKIAILSTVQFVSTIQKLCQELSSEGFNVISPQVRPLSRGEVLGCTAPILDEDTQSVVFVADGRFHLEAVMIANPWIKEYFRYNPYDKQITKETYHFDEMIVEREENISQARKIIKMGGKIGFILGTLGRQGSPRVLESMIESLEKTLPDIDYITLLIPEIKPFLLEEIKEVDVWVQTSCPRLSIDWGNDFIHKPLLNPHEFKQLIMTLNQSEVNIIHSNNSSDNKKAIYPMDFYASSSQSNWTPIHKCSKTCLCQK